MDEVKQNIIQTLFLANSWRFIDDADSGGILPLDQDGLLMTRKEAERIFTGVMKFIDHYGNENLIDANKARQEYEAHRQEQALRSIKSQEKNRRGVVYVLKSNNGEGDLYKIGMTTRKADERLIEFAPKLPFDTELILTIRADHAERLERQLHKHFSKVRIRGEWFHLTPADLDYLRKVERQ
jgi:hypothetical protein